MTKAKEWAKELYEAGANMAEVNRELAAAMYEPDPVLSEAVRSEFTKLVLQNTKVAKRSNEQYKNWRK